MTEPPTLAVPPPVSRDLRDLIVPPAMLVVAIAAGVAGHLHFDVPLELATALALLLFSVALVGHVLFGRPRQTKRSKAQRPRRAAKPDDAAAPAQGVSLADAAAAELASGAAVLARGPMPASEGSAAEVAAGGDPAPDFQAAVDAASEVKPKIGRAAYEVSVAEALEFPGHGERSAFDLRPGDVGLATAAQQAAATGTAAPSLSQVVPAEDLAEQERITAVLRRLASQLRSDTPTLPIASDGAGTEATAPTLQSMPEAPAMPETSLSEAVDALRMTMATMRAASTPPHAEAATGAASAGAAAPVQRAAQALAGDGREADAPPPGSEAQLRLAAVADALARERVAVYLEPIIGLADDSARHFEVTVRLLGSESSPLETDFLNATPRGTEILTLLDAVRVRHSAGIAIKLERAGREGTVFSEIGGPSLASERFVRGVAEKQAHGIADRIVLTFAQSDVRGLGPAHLKALASLRDLGFRFALQGVADLDMDFEMLKLSGFEFVKLDADVFLDGLPLLGGRVPSSDICMHLASLGMAVIVGRVDDEAVRARILGFGVLFGQGELFGGARPVKIAPAQRTQQQQEQQSGAAA